VNRELHRNISRGIYDPKTAHVIALKRRGKARRPSVLTDEVTRRIRRLIRADWSPEQITGRLKENGQPAISHETIYKYIYLDKAQGGQLHHHLRCQKTRRRLYGSGKRVLIPNRISIDERPAAVDSRSRIGDWEVDTIVPSRGHKEVLLTVVERYSRFTMIAKLKNRDSFHTAERMINLMRTYKEKVLTITSDNGLEFSCHKHVSKALKADIYFAHTYKSWERGLNENTNGLIRQYFPKKTSFHDVTQAQIQRATRRLNSRPRKCLGFRTPTEVFHNREIALVT
jgi:IS30 family transposase